MDGAMSEISRRDLSLLYAAAAAEDGQVMVLAGSAAGELEAQGLLKYAGPSIRRITSKGIAAVTNTIAAGLPGGSAGIENTEATPSASRVSPGHFNSTTED